MCAVALWCSAQAQRPALEFNGEGKFKIAQFTDVHLDLGNPYRQAQAEKTIAQMRYILDAERPDLVVFTGDVVTGKPAAEGWKRVLAPVAERNLPFCVVLEIAGKKSPAALLYCLDSHDYSTVEGIDGYGWFTQDQIRWYRDRSAAYTGANGGKPLPALAFFHIALPEYVAAWRNPDNTHIGRAAEDECPGELNPGMFAAMVESGDVTGVFVGHDHDIDYVVAEKGIALGYGRFSGDDTTYNNLRPGVRLLVLTEGERGFETWIHERDGRIVDHVEFRDGRISKVKNSN